jgi:hypothetical protein
MGLDRARAEWVFHGAVLSVITLQPAAAGQRLQP